MDAVRPDAQELSAASRWSGHASPHELAEALSLILPLLPLDARARAACVCRAWRTATSNPLLWEELRFAHCAAHVRDATLARLCARAGTALRTLDLDADACTHITAAGVLAALRGGGCTGVRHLNMPPKPRASKAAQQRKLLTVEMVQQLVVACPTLQRAACAACCGLAEMVTVLTALPGLLRLELEHEELNIWECDQATRLGRL